MAIAAANSDATKFSRPDPKTVKHLATCKLQSLGKSMAAPTMQGAEFVASQPTPDVALANYERTPLGDWQMSDEVDRADPWLRFLLLGPKRPLVIDVAVFIDGKPYSDGREAWIDDVLKPATPNTTAQSAQPLAGDVQSPSVAVTNTKPVPPNPTEPKPKTVVAAIKSEPKVTAQVRQAPNMRERLQSLRRHDWSESRAPGNPLARRRMGFWSAGGCARFESFLAASRDGALTGIFGPRS